MIALRLRWFAACAVVLFMLVGCGQDVEKKKNDPPPSSCGDGLLAPSEKCDPAIEAGNIGACPTDCGGQTDVACSTMTLVGEADGCTAECVMTEAACANGDGCCPTGCDSTTDDDCTNTCGDGTVEGAEVCDGNCPVNCDDGDACTTDGSTGSADTCSLRCTNELVSACVDGDGCCPTGCDSQSDSDCSDSCGDGILDAGELCDGDCPTSCNDGVACTSDRLVGAAATCNAQCVFDAITQCVGGDGCCPAGCTSSVDTDCACEPRSCADVGAVCGTIDNLCGSTLNCGTCGANQTCDQGACVTANPTGALGDACTSDANCLSDDCLSAADHAMPGGYCTKGCETSTDCGAGGHCQEGVCYKSCTSNTDCRSGYACSARPGSTVSACYPTGTGTRSVGEPCNLTSECSGGNLAFCIARGDGWKDGYCSRVCNSTTSCPGGSHCAFDSDGVGLCVRDCTSSSTCRGSGFDGYLCYDRDDDGVDECAAAGTGTAGIGAPCNGTWECAGGGDAACGTERAGFPDGYCVKLCGANSSCPAGSHCGFTLASGYCIDSCNDATDCRAEYSCQTDFIGNACWPQ